MMNQLHRMSLPAKVGSSSDCRHCSSWPQVTVSIWASTSQQMCNGEQCGQATLGLQGKQASTLCTGLNPLMLRQLSLGSPLFVSSISVVSRAAAIELVEAMAGTILPDMSLHSQQLILDSFEPGQPMKLRARKLAAAKTKIEFEASSLSQLPQRKAEHSRSVRPSTKKSENSQVGNVFWLRYYSC